MPLIKVKYNELQMIKHALQHYVKRDGACSKDVEQENRLLDKVEIKVNRTKEEYRIK